MRAILVASPLFIAGTLLASCNFAIGLGGYDFESSGGPSSTSTSTTTSASTSASTSTSSAEGGHDAGTTTAGSAGSGGATTTSASGGHGGTGGQGGSLPSGDVVWSLGIDTQTVTVGGVGVDLQGNVYVTGSYSAAGMSALTGCGYLLGTNSATRGFLVKLDATKKCVGAMSLGEGGSTMGTAIAVAPQGEVTLAVRYNAGMSVPGSDTLPAPVLTDAFVVRYPAGADFAATTPTPAKWLQRIGDAGDQAITDLALDGSGNVWVTGWYTTSLIAVGATSLTKMGVGQNTGFVLRLDAANGGPDPNAVRLFATTSSQDVEALAVATRAGGDIAVGGRSYGGVDFGEGPETHKGYYDGFFARYTTPAMTYQGGAWLSDIYDQIVRDVAYDAQGDLYVAGNFYGTLDFHSGVTLAQSAQRTFLARVDAGGTAQKAIAIGDADAAANIRCAALPGGGGVVFAGMMRGTVSLPGSPPLSVPTMNNDVVVGRIDPTLSNGIWLHAWGDAVEQGADALAVGPHGEVVVAGHFSGKFPFDASQTFNGAALFVARISP